MSSGNSRLDRSDHPQHNLPASLTKFIGREQELDGLIQLLSQSRLVTLTGAGGSGKTRLAMQAAGRLIGKYSDGVWVIELATLTDPTLVTQTIATTVQIQEKPGVLLIETLSMALHRRELLLILDNCEHLYDSCTAVVKTLLNACPGVHVLATSRHALGISGENIHPVAGLSIIDSCTVPTAKQLTAGSEAAQLFIERARSIQPHFQLTDQNASPIARICQRLDGMPLAIELAAARMKVLSAQQIADRLESLFGLLTRGDQTALPRHQTLRATIDWSYEFLSMKTRTLFHRLSVFAGTFSLSAIEEVCAGDGLEKEEILDLLSDLVDQSLVLASEQESLEETRYKLIEMIRQYSQEKLEAAGEAEQLRKRHVAFFLHLAEEADSRMLGNDQVRWLQRLNAEHDNLRAALRWSFVIANAVKRIEVPDLGLRLAGSLWMFWEFNGFFTEGLAWLEKALANSNDLPSSARAKVLTGAGTMSWHQGNLSQAVSYHEFALGAYRAIDDPSGVTFALNNLAMQYMEQGLYDRAEALGKESLERYRSLGDSQGIAMVLNNMGVLARNRGDWLHATEYYQECLLYARRRADKRLLAILLSNMGELAQDREEYENAITLYEESISLFEEFGDHTYMAVLLLRMRGDIALMQGEVERAAQIFRERLQLCSELGDKNEAAESVERLARVLHVKGSLQASTQLLGAADSLRKANSLPLYPASMPVSEWMVSRLRDGLGEDTFKAAWIAGETLAAEGWEKVISFALAPPASSELHKAPDRLPSRLEAAKQKYGGLTARERDVAVQIAQGKTNQEIAAELFVGLKTVEMHVTNILAKLGFTSRAQIAAWAVGKGLAEAPAELDVRAREE